MQVERVIVLFGIVKTICKFWFIFPAPVLHRAHYFEESSVPCSSGAERCKAALEGEGGASGTHVAAESDPGG